MYIYICNMYMVMLSVAKENSFIFVDFLLVTCHISE